VKLQGIVDEGEGQGSCSDIGMKENVRKVNLVKG
jgi:hypothetical protein